MAYLSSSRHTRGKKTTGSLSRSGGSSGTPGPLSPETTAVSLAWGLQGLAAHQDMPEKAKDWLAAAYHRLGRMGPSAYRSALVALAVLGEASPLVSLPRRELGG